MPKCYADWFVADDRPQKYHGILLRRMSLVLVVVFCCFCFVFVFLIFARVLYGAGKTWNSVADVKLEHAVDTSREPITVKDASVDSDAFTLVPTGE